MPLRSWIFAAVEAAVHDAVEPAQEIASRKIYSKKLMRILGSGGTWPGQKFLFDYGSEGNHHAILERELHGTPGRLDIRAR